MNVKKEDMKRINEIIVCHKRYGSEDISICHNPEDCIDMIESIMRKTLKTEFVESFPTKKADDVNDNTS